MRQYWTAIGSDARATGTAFVEVTAFGPANPARAAAEWVPEFADSTGAIGYCANGDAAGVANETAWWEWTLCDLMA